MQIVMPMHCEMIVAAAAPAIPIGGMIRQPKMNSGSSSTFTPRPSIMEKLASRESPHAISRSLPAMQSEAVAQPKNQISI